MLRSEVRTLARRYARMNTAGAADTFVNDLINLGQKQFAKDVHGLPARAYLPIQARFDVDTTMAIRVTITGSTNNNISATDIAIASADANDQTGTAVASSLQTAIRTAIGGGADLTVSWASFYFTIDAIDAAATITIASPTTDTYSDATPRLFGKTGSGTQTFVGDFPEDCTAYADLPSDFTTLTAAYWDGHLLYDSPREYTAIPKTFGTPRNYTIIGTKMYLSPVPEEQKELYIEYKATPDDITSDTQMNSLIPDDIQIGIAYWVSSELLKMTFEDDQAKKRYADYLREKSRYIMRYHNAQTESSPGGANTPLWYRVET